MTGIINKTRFLERTVLYHEKKVQNKTATFLDAGFYLQDPDQLTVPQKLSRLTSRMLLNERCQVNVMTFSMHFDRSDQLSASALRRIAAMLLQEFGFDKQPYLLYEHHDTLHKHIHVVSTLIRPDGSRIPDKEMSLPLFQKAQRAVETRFGLKNPNSDASPAQAERLQTEPLSPSQSRLVAIRSAVQSVQKHYRFSSFSEYNALLRQFGVQACAGGKNSYLFKVGGLLYRTIDARGRATCKAVKASSIDAKATLKALTESFAFHRVAKAQHISRLTNTVDLALAGEQVVSLKELAAALETKGVKIHLLKERKQTGFQLIYIDNRTLCAFDAASLDQKYHFKGLCERCYHPNTLARHANSPLLGDRQDPAGPSRASESPPQVFEAFQAQNSARIDALLHDLFMPAFGFEPPAVRKPYKKRKRKASH